MDAWGSALSLTHRRALHTVTVISSDAAVVTQSYTSRSTLVYNFCLYDILLYTFCL